MVRPRAQISEPRENESGLRSDVELTSLPPFPPPVFPLPYFPSSQSLFAPPPPPKTALGRECFSLTSLELLSQGPVDSFRLPPPLAGHRILSPTAGIKVSPLQLGAMSIGEAWGDFMGSMSKEDSFKLLDAFVEAGGNFIGERPDEEISEGGEWR